jgi:arylsulfatase A-like enzyme
MRIDRLLLPLLIAATACAPQPGEVGPQPPPAADEWMAGLLVTDQPVVVAPNPQWVADKERDLWGVAASGTLAVYVTTPPAEPLVITMELGVGDPHSLFCSWDGEPVAAGWLEVAASRLTLSIPPAFLAAGSHALSIVRTDQPLVEGDSSRLELTDLGWQLGGRETRLEPGLLHRYHYLAGFLLQGVTGSNSTERLGGVLFEGPRRVTLPLTGAAAGRLAFKVQNSSPGDAVFGLRVGDREATVRVASHDKAALAIPVEAGDPQVELTADGPPEGLYLWGAPQLQPAAPPARAPIVLITLDTTRRDVVPPYAADDRLMPHLAAFARQATVYRRAAATSPWTLPSHASMLTGLYPSRHRAGVTDQELIASRVTAPELLRRHGWLTAGFAGGMFCGSRFGLSQGFAVYHDPEGFEVAGDRLTDLAVALLGDAARLRPFLFVNYFDPHFPYHAPARLRADQDADRLAGAAPDDPLWRSILGGDGAAWTRAVIDDIPFPAAALAAVNAEYRAEVAFMDEQLGRLLDSLRQHGLWDEALIIAVADHGELLGEHRVLGHGGRLDPELVEVPLIVKFPHQRQAAAVDDLVSIVDLFPTMLEAAGVPAPPSDGLPLPRRDGRDAARRELVFSEEHAMGIHKLFGRLLVADDLYGIERRAQREVVWRGGHDCFTLGSSGWAAGACVASSPLTLVEEHLQPPRLLAGQQVPDLGEEEMERLKALGYAR